MFLIEDDKHKIVPDGNGRRVFRSLDKLKRPDGGTTSNAKLGTLADENGLKLKICEIIFQNAGEGSKIVSESDPTYKDTDNGKEWVITKTYAKERKKPDPTEETDEFYADRYKEHRRDAYNRDGLITEEMMVALWEKVVESRSESADALEVKRQAVKKRFPKPKE